MSKDFVRPDSPRMASLHRPSRSVLPFVVAATIGLAGAVVWHGTGEQAGLPQATASPVVENVAEVTPAQALDRLREGNRRFATAHAAHPHAGVAWARQLASGQHPFAVVLTCSDSRVAPELLFDQGLGDLFVVRVAGNVVDPDVIGSIEYAVDHLHTQLVIVMGHENCGAVTARSRKSPPLCPSRRRSCTCCTRSSRP
jgi:carbonic anhydrase